MTTKDGRGVSNLSSPVARRRAARNLTHEQRSRTEIDLCSGLSTPAASHPRVSSNTSRRWASRTRKLSLRVSFLQKNK